MNDLMSMPVFKVYAAVSAALFLKTLLITFATAAVRGKHKTYTLPEDAKTFKTDQAAADADIVQRLKRMSANATENEVPFFVIGLLYFLVGASQGAAQIYFYTFFFARLVHALCFALKLQPIRSLAWAVSWFALFGMSLHILLVTFGVITPSAGA